MTEKDLKELKLINLEIDRTATAISRLSNSKTNAELRCKYINILQEQEAILLQKKIEAEQFIKEIDNAEIRIILTLKFIDLKSWNYISRKLHYDRTTLLKKIKKFFEKTQNNIHKTPH